MTSPLQLHAMLAVERAKTAARFKLEGDAIIEVDKDGKSLGKGNVLEKRALLERLVRLGATDVPGTPRLLMRQRSPQELGALQNSVESGFAKVTDPIKQRVSQVLGKVPHPGVRKALQSGADILINNPETIPMQALPIPGLTPGWLAAKRGMEKAIDHVAPVKVAAGAPTRGGFMMASDVPPMRVPSLRAPVEKVSEGVKAAEVARIAVQEASAALHKVGEALTKVGDSLPDFATYDPGDFKPANLNAKPKMAEGAGDGMSMSQDTAANNQQPEDFREKDLREKKSSVMDVILRVFDERMKKADVSPSVSWNPGYGGAQRQASFIPPMTAPSLRAPVAKVAAAIPGGIGPMMGKSLVPPPSPPSSPFQAAQTAKTVGTPKVTPPGPSIAEQSKPKGPGFGSGIAGAFKGRIGGTGPVDLGTKLGPGTSK